MSLVLWIADHLIKIRDLLAYVDDNFSWELAHKTLFYHPYGRFFPKKQARLLLLWDDLHIPHEEHKQEFGSTLTIIGFRVDSTRMEITMSDEYKTDLLDAVHRFCSDSLDRRHTLHEFQRLTGWINWGLNVQPRLRPGLASMYEKMSGKSQPHQSMWVSRRICRDLSWLAQHYAARSGVFLLEAIAWGPLDADITVFTDTSMCGLGFWVLRLNIRYSFNLPGHPPADTIFFFEAYVVCCAFHWCSAQPQLFKRVAVFSDNKNTVEIFNTMRAYGHYNSLLRFVVDVIIDSDIDLRVYHIPGERNIVADALSRHLITLLQHCCPHITILPYTPPPSLGEALHA